MTAKTFLSTIATNLGAAEGMMGPGDSAEGKLRIDNVTVGTNNTANDIYLMLPIPSNATLKELKMWHEALDSSGSPTLTLDIGIANGPIPFKDGSTLYAADAAISATLFLSASDQHAANTGTDIVAGNIVVNYAEIDAPLWKRAGLSADPSVVFFVQVKLHAAAATATTSPTIVLAAHFLGA